MNKKDFGKILASATIDSFPSIIKKDILCDEIFFQNIEIPIEVNVQISIRDKIISFTRSSFIEIIKKIYQDNTFNRLTLNDIAGISWEFYREAQAIIIENNEYEFKINDYYYLNSETNDRLLSFKNKANEVNLPENKISYWTSILKVRTLLDYEIELINIDIENTPTYVFKKINNEWSSCSEIETKTLVPDQKDYYTQLIGEHLNSTNLVEYADNEAVKHLEFLSTWDGNHAIRLMLLMSSDALISNQINADHLSNDNISNIFDYMVKNGDPFSKVAAIEFGLKILEKHPQIEKSINTLIQSVLAYGASTNNDVEHLANLFILVDAELSRLKLYSDMPVFYRRLAAISQASLIFQATQGAPSEVHFSEFIKNNFNNLFFIQNLHDMRETPIWSPEFLSAAQLKNILIIRVINACNLYKSDNINLVANTFVNNLEGIKNIEDYIIFPSSFYSNPFDGTLTSLIPLPNELSSNILKQLDEEELNAMSVMTLVHSAFIFKVDDSVIIKALENIKKNTYSLVLHHVGQFQFVAKGLAMVAATNRNKDLADALRIIVRINSRNNFNLAVTDLFSIGLIAAAAHPIYSDWAQYLSNWIEEISFSNIQKKDALILHTLVNQLIQVDPKLVVKLGRSQATLEAIL